jgi:NhaP-type Na+/H+ and K+/H+ antiporter
MTNISIITQSSKAVLVIQQMSQGMSVSQACKDTGIPRSTFYDIIAREPEAVKQFQELVRASQSEQLCMILASQTKLLQKVIEDGLAGSTRPNHRAAIYKVLGDKSQKLTELLQLEDHSDDGAADFLKGIQLRRNRTDICVTSEDITLPS